MRKHLFFHHPHHHHRPAVPPQYPPPPLSHQIFFPAVSPAPSFDPSVQLSGPIKRESFFFPSIPVAKSIFDLATISIIAGLILLSLFAISYIFHLRLRSRRRHHLQNFNALWTVRLLLVSLAFLWAVNEILRLPIVRRKYLFPFLPSVTLQQQANICKFHVVVSLGFLEPGFFITLLFLVNVSIKKRNPRCIWALVSLLMVCGPMVLLQAIFVYLSPFQSRLPGFMHGSSAVAGDMYGNRTVLCTYPFFSGLIFSLFTIAYAVAFLYSCWRVMSFVINKGIRNRINALATSVMVALPVQILCLSMSWLWNPEESAYGCVILAMFLCIAGSMAVGEVILVVKPITDALAAGGDCCVWSPDGISSRPAAAVDDGGQGSNL